MSSTQAVGCARQFCEVKIHPECSFSIKDRRSFSACWGWERLTLRRRLANCADSKIPMVGDARRKPDVAPANCDLEAVFAASTITYTQKSRGSFPGFLDRNNWEVIHNQLPGLTVRALALFSSAFAGVVLSYSANSSSSS